MKEQRKTAKRGRKPKETSLSTPPSTPLSTSGEFEINLVHQDLSQAARMIQERIAALVFPPDFDVKTYTLIGPMCKYNPIIHAKLCRFVMLGMKPGRAARIVGISPETLRTWRETFPKLDADLEEAAQLTNAYAMLLFQKFIGRSDELGLRALIKYLESHCEEFRTKQEFEVGAAPKADDVARSIRQNVYGIIDNAKPGEVDHSGNGRNVGLLEAGAQMPLEGAGETNVNADQGGNRFVDRPTGAVVALVDFGGDDVALVALPQDAPAAAAAAMGGDEIDFSFI